MSTESREVKRATSPVFKFEIIGKPRTAKNSKRIGWVRDFRAKGGMRYILLEDKKVEKWRKAAVPQLEGQWVGRQPLGGKLAVIVTSYLGKRQRGDTDNLLAGPLDALEKARIVTNDSVFERTISIRRHDWDNPRCEIVVMPDDFLWVAIRDPGGAP